MMLLPSYRKQGDAVTDAEPTQTDTAPEDSGRLNILITGATSKLGRDVMHQLAGAGHRVAGIAAGAEDAVTVREAGGLPVYIDPYRPQEIASTLRMIDADVALNLAPQVPNGVPYNARDWDLKLLGEGTQALLEGAKIAGVDFLVHISYAFLYAPSEEPVDESGKLLKPGDDPLLNAAIKAERAVLKSGVPGCVLRAGYGYGPHSPHTIALAGTLRVGRPVPSSDNVANWIHTDDLVAAVQGAMTARPSGEVINIVDDRPSTSHEFLLNFAELLGLDAPGRSPGFLTRAIAGRIPSQLLGLSSQASNQKAHDLLDWEPRFSTHKEGIAHTLMIWRAETVV
jgi:nucleoside-diphosphate-sugar epimerase